MERNSNAIDFTKILPNEVLFNICNNLTRTALQRCVRVNRALRPVSTYLLEHKRKIRLVDDTLNVLFVALETAGKTLLIRNLAGAKRRVEQDTPQGQDVAHVYRIREPTVSLRGMNRMITLVDAPNSHWHRNQVWIQAYKCDVCVLVLNGFTKQPGNLDYEAMVTDLMLGCCHMMSSRDVIVAININSKDANAETIFTKLRLEISRILNKSIGPSFDVIPVDAENKTNLQPQGATFAWFKDSDLLTLLRRNQSETNYDAEKVAKLRKDMFEFQLCEKHKIGGIGTVAIGRVISGSIARHAEVKLMPGGWQTEVKCIENHLEVVPRAEAGDCVSLHLFNTSVRDLKKKSGFITLRTNPAQKIDIAMALRVQLVVLKPAKTMLHNIYKVYYGGSRICCMLWWVLPSSQYQKRKDLQKLKKATAIMLPLARIPMRVYRPSDFQKNIHGKVMLCQKTTVVAIGRIDKVIASEMDVGQVAQPSKQHIVAQYNLVVERAAELFNSDERELQRQLVEHVTTDPGARSVLMFEKSTANWDD